MKPILASAILAVTVLGAAPASAQSIGIGPDGPRIDLRSRAQRERDYDRAMMRRDRDYDRGLYRSQRYDDDRRGYRRDYGY
ncbi:MULTISPECIES: hypothetical protein [Methylobacterium]|jgi:hypothetical protein|uniref:Uncharacterized protein n=1 Tax=Methylobacterium jeotgali TaxID=381630 RepID=A0ABQ4SVZ6_9HYPH|nr:MULTISPECIES: hypothetical protein [Methylobacterium]PIU07551.1 MAG: hypothetical protein COT56_04845 [Methylobacterium sp. CG09_land_8_20_14_0_10_71_15]PIU13338.1 MAG: hypothetical protein COT28_11985 [Methylobacterium sp. CG08_land_8_20_14_0_20_71_15]GBU17749.1 hypothetical protein AwMethylo_19640 [Methylobacterium sp.]GJE06421.1 hypothetical protein AOPFMNJM_1739 [Methylobacterium jeotgali]